MKIILFIITLFTISSGLQAKSSNRNDKKLDALIDQVWGYSLSRSPQLETSFGGTEHADQLNDVSSQYQLQTSKSLQKFLDKFKKINRSKLSLENKINYDMSINMIGDRIADIDFKEFLMPINSLGSFYINLARMSINMQFRTTKDYENYLAKLQQIPRVFDQHIVNMRQGLKIGMTQPQVVIQSYPDLISQYISNNPEESSFYQPFISINKNITKDQANKFQAQARKIIESKIIPAYVGFKKFMLKEYIPGAKKDIGAYSFPNGKAYYQQQIKEYTTLDLTPKEINDIGWKEVKRIRTEMEAVIKQVEFKGSFAEFLAFLRTDEQFYAKTAEELLKQASFIAKKMDGKLPSLFTKLPRQPYTVNPVPEKIAVNYTTGRYVPAPLDSTRPGQYWVNTHALEMRPLYNLEALTVHEAVPGHHLQIALNKELQGLPKFRRYSYISAFGEGWGLYCEKLAKEVGFYQDPYSEFGRLTYEMWRAMRLVVDTGMHALGMSRDEAIKLMEENTALSKLNIRTEIDRYISVPAQALSYKLGEIKIWELRAKAEKALAEKFDIRAFHDAILSKGTVPLSVLEQIIDTYIQQSLNE